MSFISDLYSRVRYLLRYRRNPAMYVAVGVVVLLTAWRVANGMPIEDALTENYVEKMLILAGGVLTRLQVFSPEAVEDLFASREADAVAGHGDAEDFEDFDDSEDAGVV
ncbi:hypothetical protein [Streptomonospora wellingtoniae]|uniref:Uncharacterized protein n=1 Tax=Streptomonospora wellingtoniae TaxID=3075544 RepID=A0ABU2KV06_9ACTN|nr:hypothetical protein [Streptomonospora sp. DSM 45055]MDT0302888.1 hypothetical protein [Streptomonospora sp. DSM 45055]